MPKIWDCVKNANLDTNEAAGVNPPSQPERCAELMLFVHGPH
jgi:hypothetical protein